MIEKLLFQASLLLAHTSLPEPLFSFFSFSFPPSSLLLFFLLSDDPVGKQWEMIYGNNPLWQEGVLLVPGDQKKPKPTLS